MIQHLKNAIAENSRYIADRIIRGECPETTRTLLAVNEGRFHALALVCCQESADEMIAEQNAMIRAARIPVVTVEGGAA